MSNLIELMPQPIRHTPDGQRRSCLIKHVDQYGNSIDKELWFLYPPGLPMPDDDDADAYLLAALLPAMKASADIRVYGSVSHELLANLTELQLVWQKWCPSLYHAVQMQIDHVREVEVKLAGAISAFSGGADAQFTVYRHARRLAGYATRELRAGVFVHGFDIPLTDEDGFQRAAANASSVLHDLGLNIFCAKTNVRQIFDVNWEHYFAAAVASVLFGFKNFVGIGLIGSSEPYDSLLLPWGSNPISDPLCSTGEFRVIHDGGGFSRSEKIEVLSSWAIGVRNLRVCWAGDYNDRNCGYCEKCVRTRLNFLLAGIPQPECFVTPLDVSCFAHLVLRSEGARSEWCLIRGEMQRTGIGREWLPYVEKVLRRKAEPRFGYLLPLGSRRRTWVKRWWTRWHQ